MANGLRICCLHCSGSGHRCGMDLIPGLGLLHAAGAAKKKKKERKKKKKERKKEKRKENCVIISHFAILLSHKGVI